MSFIYIWSSQLVTTICGDQWVLVGRRMSGEGVGLLCSAPAVPSRGVWAQQFQFSHQCLNAFYFLTTRNKSIGKLSWATGQVILPITTFWTYVQTLGKHKSNDYLKERKKKKIKKKLPFPLNSACKSQLLVNHNQLPHTVLLLLGQHGCRGYFLWSVAWP